ncbi:phosphoprotein [Boana pugnax lyssa-like virus 1]|uniref:Phosphoprotein n=1 Tax=Boana pugnax lyssa-like virus 1 TaxID=2985438 RepID=A0AAE9P2R5_9RHAB|nr:phosphoprotein [Boana pugnax lyssa-like virus 1]
MYKSLTNPSQVRSGNLDLNLIGAAVDVIKSNLTQMAGPMDGVYDVNALEQVDEEDNDDSPLPSPPPPSLLDLDTKHNPFRVPQPVTRTFNPLIRPIPANEEAPIPSVRRGNAASGSPLEYLQTDWTWSTLGIDQESGEPRVVQSRPFGSKFSPLIEPKVIMDYPDESDGTLFDTLDKMRNFMVYATQDRDEADRIWGWAMDYFYKNYKEREKKLSPKESPKEEKSFREFDPILVYEDYSPKSESLEFKEIGASWGPSLIPIEGKAEEDKLKRELKNRWKKVYKVPGRGGGSSLWGLEKLQIDLERILKILKESGYWEELLRKSDNLPMRWIVITVGLMSSGPMRRDVHITRTEEIAFKDISRWGD